MSTRSTSEILKWLDDRAIGGHPDQVNPDERFRRAADIIRLQEMRAHKSADTIARLEGENVLMRKALGELIETVDDPHGVMRAWKAEIIATARSALASLASDEAKT